MAIRKTSKATPVVKASPAKSIPAAVTPIRNSAVPPKPVPAVRKTTVVTHEAIAIRAFEIWRSGKGGSSDQNWQQAERELKGL
jgi:hypothetical protein